LKIIFEEHRFAEDDVIQVGENAEEGIEFRRVSLLVYDSNQF